jgi:hypothetical protein
VIDLERALVDLADHLDHPSGDRLTDEVRRRLASPALVAGRRPDRWRSLLAVAAVFILMVVAALAIPPARHAIADWLGIGAVEVRRSDRPPAANGPSGRTVPGSPRATRSPRGVGARERLAQARRMVAFEIATPRDASAGELADVEVDRRVPGGLVALRYARFTLVELTSSGGRAPIAKLIDRGARLEHVSVGGDPGLWISGAHAIVYLDRDGSIRTDTLRRSGPVLIWVRAGVTYRIEGFDALADAQKVAVSIG